MAAPLEWVFVLKDKMSAPANAITAALVKTDVATKATEKATAALDKVEAHAAVTTMALEKSQVGAAGAAVKLATAQGKVTDATSKASASSEGFWAQLKGGASVAAGVAVAFGGVAYAIGRTGVSMFEAAAAQDRLNRAFAGSLGGKGAGAQAYLGRVAGSTELTAPQLQKLALPLARQGLGADDMQRLIPAALDVQAEGGDAARAIEVFSKIASTGKIEGEAFAALNLNAEATLRRIGSQVGINDPAKVTAAISAGQIKSEAILNGVLLSIAGTGSLGDKAAEAAKSPAAAINKLENVWDTLFSKLAASPALPVITAALGRFTEILTSPAVINGMARFFDKIGEAVGRINWEAVASGIEGLINLLAKFGVGAAESVGNVASKPTFTGRLGASIEEFTPQFVIARLVAGLFSGDSIPGAPSANDFVMRADGSVLNIDSADALIGFKPGGPIDRMTGGGSNSSQSVGDIIVHVSGGATPEATGQAIAMEVRRALLNEFDRMAIEVG